jgi:inosose dehydratase
MRLGYQTNSWGGVVGHPAGVTSIKDLYYVTPGSDELAFKEISEAGYSGVELFDGNIAAYKPDFVKLKTLLQQYRLNLIAIYSGANFIYPDVLEDELWRIEDAAAMAQALGAEHLVVGGGAIRNDGPRDDDYSRVAHGLDRVVDIADSHHLKASFHPHMGTIAQSPDQIERILDNTHIGFCPDLAHLYAGGSDVISLLQRYITRTSYIHFKDYNQNQFVPLGEGLVPISKSLELLQDSGYDGWITVELDGYSGDPGSAAKANKEFLERLGTSH